MNITVHSVSCQHNLTTTQWTCSAILTEHADPAYGNPERRFLMIFAPVTHPDTTQIITGVQQRDGHLDLTLLDLDAVADGVVVLPNAAARMKTWLPVIARAYFDTEVDRLRSYADSYADRNATEENVSMKWRREELIADIEEELLLLNILRSELPS